MTNEILTLRLDEVRPDPEQPRQHFDREAMERLKAAIQAVGQLQPIRVRKNGDGYMIVDGQRRWLALSALSKANPFEERFQEIRAFVGNGLDEAQSSRRIVQVLSNIGEDLTPTERAMALQEVAAAEKGLDAAALGRRLGVPKGQVQFLKQLAKAPDFIQRFGSGEDGPPQPLWNLTILLRLHRKLRRYDDEQFRDLEGDYKRVAEPTVRRLGDRARDGGWGKRRLQQEADRTWERITGEGSKEEPRDLVAPLRRALSKVDELPDDAREEVVALLEGALDQLKGRSPKRRSRRASA